MKLVQDVLIGFVTTSDPGSDRGPANIITAAKAILPQVIYLLYTKATKANREALLRWLQSDSELANLTVPDWPQLDLPDVTDYERLATLLTEEIKKISKRHAGAHFHLVSGLPQARVIFALCLNAELPPRGTLWEVNPPDYQIPKKPYQPPKPQTLDKEACKKRLERWPTAIINSFRDLLLAKYKAIRLRLDVNTEQAWLDNERMDLRSRTPQRGQADGTRSRTFQTLVLLAAKKRFCEGDDVVPKVLIFKTAYSDQYQPNAAVNIRRALESINRQARRLTERSKLPLDPLIVDIKRGGRPIGSYRLTDKLNPADETIEFIGDLPTYLKKSLGVSDVRSLLPNLPTPATPSR